jgi:hypothetical protein
MAQASPTQLAVWSAAAGLGGQDQAVSVAVAMAAGGDPAGPRGAWGIGGGGDGQAQATEAAARFKASGWTTFPTHQTGGFLFYMPTATAVIQPVPGDQGVAGKIVSGLENVLPFGQQAKGIGEAIGGGVSGVVHDVTEPFLVPIKFLEDPTTWIRLAKIVTGVALIVLAGAKFGMDNVFGAPARLLDRAGDEVANRASVVGIFGGPTGRVAAGAATVIHNHPTAPERPAAAPTPRRTAARKRTPPPPESPRVAEARRLVREAGEEKRKQRDEEQARKAEE